MDKLHEEGSASPACVAGLFLLGNMLLGNMLLGDMLLGDMLLPTNNLKVCLSVIVDDVETNFNLPFFGDGYLFCQAGKFFLFLAGLYVKYFWRRY